MTRTLMLKEPADPQIVRAMARIATDPGLEPFAQWLGQLECEQLENLRDTDEATGYYRGTSRLLHDLVAILQAAPGRMRQQVSMETVKSAHADHAGDRQVGPANPARPTA